MEKYVPDIYQKSIYTINYEKLKQNGIKCILFDLDNTIAPARSSVPTKKSKELIDSLKADFKLFVFSNAMPKRVKKFSDELGVDFYAFSLKPFQKNFKKLFKEHKFNECEVAIIGDQILTDIAGGNTAGIKTILVNPVSTKDSVFTKLNRFLENKKIKKLSKKNLFFKGKYYE